MTFLPFPFKNHPFQHVFLFQNCPANSIPLPKTPRPDKTSIQIHIHASSPVVGACTAFHCCCRTKVRIGRLSNSCIHARTPAGVDTKVGQYWQMRRYICQALSVGVGVTEHRRSGRTVIASIVWSAPDSIRIESRASSSWLWKFIHHPRPRPFSSWPYILPQKEMAVDDLLVAFLDVSRLLATDESPLVVMGCEWLLVRGNLFFHRRVASFFDFLSSPLPLLSTLPFARLARARSGNSTGGTGEQGN